MAINATITHTQDLNGQLTIIPLRHVLATGDQLGDRFDITVLRGGEPVDLSSVGVNGYFIREDKKTVTLIGSASGSIASVTLAESCYVVPGQFTLVIKISSGDVRHAVFACVGVVAKSSTDELIDPGHNIPDIDELLAMISQIENTTKEAGKVISSANDATKKASDAAAYIKDITVSAHNIQTGGTPTVTKSDVGNHLHLDFGVVQGPKGDPGKDGTGAGTVRDVAGVQPDEYGHVPLEIGGRQLYRNTNDTLRMSSYDDSGWIRLGQDNFQKTHVDVIDINDPPVPGISKGIRIANDDGANMWAGVRYKPLVFPVGTMVTISCYARSIKGAPSLNLQLQNSNANDESWSSSQIPLNASWTRISASFAISRDIGAISSFLTLSSRAGGTSFELCGMKLEVGNVATDWSPAPEDIESRVRALEEKIAAMTT